MKDLKLDPRNDLRRAVVVAFASVLMALNIKTFVRTGGLYPGGVTGLTVLFQRIALQYFHVELPFSVVNILLNAFPVYVGFKFIGKKFTLLSCEMIVISAVLTDLIPTHPLTYDTLLIAIFGGLINGVVTTLCLRVNATTGGMDFISIYLSQKRGLDGFTIVLGFNAVVLLIAGYFFGWDKALYSIIYQYVSTQIVNLLHQRYKFSRLDIVTTQPDEVCSAIFKVCRHGITKVPCEGAFSHSARWLLLTTVNTYELQDVIRSIKQTDPTAFITVSQIGRIIGNYHQTPLE